MDILDVGTPSLSWSRLWNLIEHLPRDSHYARAVVGPSIEWGYVEHLLACVIDLLEHQTWQYAQAHSKTPVKRPRPFARPGVRRPGLIGPGPGEGYSVEEMRVMLDRRRQGLPAKG